MKKKLLFIMNNLACGGAEKSLISLLEQLDYEQYDVDLLLFQHTGIFMRQIPRQVRLLDEPAGYRYFDMPLGHAVMTGLRQGQFRTVWARMRAGWIFRYERNRARCEQRAWKYMAKSLPLLAESYDAAIGYLEKNPNYYCVDRVSARIKIGYIHNDYEQLRMDPVIDEPYFRAFHHIVTVSEQCKQVLKATFPTYSYKMTLIHNIVSPQVIREMALARVPDQENAIQENPIQENSVQESRAEIMIVSVGRLHKQKGFDLAVEACTRLVEQGVRVRWHVLGEGEERANLTRLICERGLQDSFLLHGLCENPYAYMGAADLYVQPSRFEGKSIAIDEAKILHKPIIATCFSTVRDQLEDGVNGLVVELNGEALFKAIMRLIQDETLRRKLTLNLARETPNTEKEIHKFYELIG